MPLYMLAKLIPAPASTRARCLAGFDLDPKKKELAFGARSYLRLRLTLTDSAGIISSSEIQDRLSEDAPVGQKMEEAQMESFDEDLFGEASPLSRA